MSMGEKLLTIAKRMRDVYGKGTVIGYTQGYDNGKSDGVEIGFTSGFNRGHDAGKKAQWDHFWDVNQQNGTRKNYQYAYVGTGFDFRNFYPKYDIVVEGAFNQAFALWNIDADRHKGSLKQRLDECGVRMDLSGSTNLLQVFLYSKFTELPAIALPPSVNNRQIFGQCSDLHTIEKLIVSEGTNFDECFKNTVSLENIEFQGVIGQNGLDLSDCTRLSRESLLSLLACLKDYAGTSSHTVTLGSKNLAKLTESEKEEAAAKGWRLV